MRHQSQFYGQIQRVRRLGNEMTAMEIRKQPDTNVCPLWAFHIFY